MTVENSNYGQIVDILGLHPNVKVQCDAYYLGLLVDMRHHREVAVHRDIELANTGS